jgi:hypothetical protein
MHLYMIDGVNVWSLHKKIMLSMEFDTLRESSTLQTCIHRSYHDSLSGVTCFLLTQTGPRTHQDRETFGKSKSSGEGTFLLPGTV